MLRTMSIMLMLSVCGGAGAQSLYKCTSEGKITYSGAPCKEGEMKAIEVPPAPPANAARAQELQRDKVALQALERSRSQRERVEKSSEAESGAAAKVQRCATLRAQQKEAEDNAERAPGFKKASMREQARIMAEAMAVECPS